MLGVRGSTAAPGAAFTRYGGHTSCVAVVAGGATDPALVLDAGTGLRSLTAVLGGRPYRGAILLSHLHWDHVQGLPFFASGDRPDADVELFMPAQNGLSGRDLLALEMSPPAFPIEPEGLQGTWRFHAIEAASYVIGGLHVTAADVRHKGGRTLGYRIESGGRSIAYVPDHAPSAGCSDDLRGLLEGVDLLVHDGQFLESERAVADLYAHATVDDAIALATDCGVGRLVLFHHSPARTDDQLDELASRVAADASLTMPVVVAREGEVIDVLPSAR